MQSVSREKSLVSLNRYALSAAICWMVIVAVSLSWNIFHQEQAIREMAINEAVASFRRDDAFRQFIASRGGIYVPRDDKTPSNPYLNHPERDVTSTSGKKLTLMNAAYVFHKVMEEYGLKTGVNWRLTSLKPLNAANAPDEWERRVLAAFEKDRNMVISFEDVKGEPHLRLLSPLVTTAACLKCHAWQGYGVGQIRGAMGVNIPMRPYLAAQLNRTRELALAHAGFLLLGFIGIGFIYTVLRTNIVERSRVHEALRHAGAYNRSLIEASLDPLVTIGPDGKIMDVNRATEAVTGHTRKELIGTDFCDYFSDPEGARAGYEQAFREGLVRDYPLDIRHRDGYATPVLYNATVYRDEQGDIRGVFAAARDVKERRRAEETVATERQRLNGVLEMLPAYVVLLTQDYRISFANRFFRERFGEDRGRRCYEYLFGQSEPCENCETYKVLKTGGAHRWEWTGPDGRNYDIHDFPFTDTDGSILILEMGIDITEIRQAQSALRQRLDELERFRDATIKREFRIRELKERVRELETEVARLRS